MDSLGLVVHDRTVDRRVDADHADRRDVGSAGLAPDELSGSRWRYVRCSRTGAATATPGVARIAADRVGGQAVLLERPDPQVGLAHHVVDRPTDAGLDARIGGQRGEQDGDPQGDADHR